MAKKILKGRTKLSVDAAPGKELPSPTPSVIPTKEREFPKSFRLTESDLKKLKQIQEAVNARSSIKFSEAKILRALIAIGENTKPERIIKAFGNLL